MLEFSLVDGRLLARSSLALLGGAVVRLVVILFVALGEVLLTLLLTILLVTQAIVFS